MGARPDHDAPSSVFAAGAVLGHYRIEARIGAGGMGVVYRARDEQLGREVALKVLPWSLPRGAPERQRLHQEARALSRLNHPNIATVYDFLTDDERDVIVMEFVPGETLSDRLVQGPLPEATVVGLGLQLADGLAAAHDHDVIHRDVKPANLRVTPEGRLEIWISVSLASSAPKLPPRPRPRPLRRGIPRARCPISPQSRFWASRRRASRTSMRPV